MRVSVRYVGLMVSAASGVNPTKLNGADCTNASVNGNAITAKLVTVILMI